MEEKRNPESETLDSYIRKVEDQELKGILLKLKNEMRKPDVSWDIIRTVLRSLMKKDHETLNKVIPLILS